MLPGMKIICERCQAERRPDVIDDDSAGAPATHIRGLCLEHAFAVLEELRVALLANRCSRRRSRRSPSPRVGSCGVGTRACRDHRRVRRDDTATALPPPIQVAIYACIAAMDSHRAWEHPWLGIVRRLRTILGTPCDPDRCDTVSLDLRSAAAERVRIAQSGWFN